MSTKNLELLVATPIGCSLLLLSLSLVLLACRHYRYGTYTLLLSSANLIFFSVPLVAFSLIGNLETKYPALPFESLSQHDVAVVLGGVVELPVGPRIRAGLGSGADRVVNAARLFKSGSADKVLVSGGSSGAATADESEAHYVTAFLLEMGVPRDKIVVDAISTSTGANALESIKLMNEHQLQSAILVTSAFHMTRAVMHFNALGVRVTPFPVDYRVSGYQKPIKNKLIPTVEALGLSTLALHEYVGMFAHQLKKFLTSK